MFKAIPLLRLLQHLTAGSSIKDTSLGTTLGAQRQRRFTNMKGAHLLAISTIWDPSTKKLSFFNHEASRQAEQRIIQEAKAFIPVESNTVTLKDEGGETSAVNKPASL